MAILWQSAKEKLKATNYSRTHQKQYSKMFTLTQKRSAHEKTITYRPRYCR
ncbi:MAG: hypothetical protein RLZZ156_1018 [Deinococcota bacterium]|jgi:predicted site-specific integrase-resolvase